MRTNRVFGSVCRFLPRLLLWKQHNRGVVFCSCKTRVRLFDGVSDISPHVWSIVTIKEYQTFVYILLVFRRSDSVSKLVGVCVFKVLSRSRFSILVNLFLETMSCDLIKVVLISLASDDVDDFVEGSFRVLLLVFWEVIAENAIIWDFLEGDLWQPDTLLRHLLIKLSLGCRFTASSVQVLLSRESDVFCERRLSHSWQTNGHEKDLLDWVHLLLGY